MKKLKEELFINAEEVYGKELIDKLRQKIYDIGWAIISDEYLVNTIRLNRSDKYGLVKYEESTYYDEANYDYSNTITASFILEPIYDKIIY